MLDVLDVSGMVGVGCFGSGGSCLCSGGYWMCWVWFRGAFGIFISGRDRIYRIQIKNPAGFAGFKPERFEIS